MIRTALGGTAAVMLAVALVASTPLVRLPEQLPAKLPETPSDWRANLADFRFRWTAEPGIDLVSGPAVPLRAYVESWRVVLMESNMGAAYPGFEAAVPENQELTYENFIRPREVPPYMLTSTRPMMDEDQDKLSRGNWARYTSKRYYGNELLRILSLKRVPGGWQAYVCDGLYKVFRNDGTGYSPVTSLPGWEGPPGEPLKDIRLWHVEISDAEGSVTANDQSGEDPRPAQNVFTPWRIRGADPDSGWEAHPDLAGSDYSESFSEFSIRRQQCSDAMPDGPVARKAIARWTDIKPLAEKAVPGWPSPRAL